MKITIILILITLSLNAQIDRGTLHSIAGQAIGMPVGYYVYKKTNSIGKGMFACVAAAFVVGTIKEISDKYLHTGTYNPVKILDTGWGGMVGAACLVPFMVHHQNKLYQLEERYGDINTNIFVHEKDSLN